MAATETIPTPTGFKPTDDSNPNFRSISSISQGVNRTIEPVGPAFMAFARRKRLGRTFSEDERIQQQNKVKKVEDEDDGEISEEEDPLMLARDAKDWRGQDHYAVLGLSKYRWKATDDQIKRAHRKKVLRHHPDKKAAAGESDTDSFFKCIQRANEILTDPVRRRQFDSVDEKADREPPSKKEVQKPGAFYKKWGAVFASEGRFSNKQPVPGLGNDNSTKEEVEEFYDFFYNFDSWRSFEYLDEDVPDDNADRDHKRHIERKNNNARRKRKSEDIARLRKLVDDCLAGDERIARFRKAEKANKNKKRDEAEALAKKQAEEKKAQKEADEKRKQEEETKAKADKESNKKAKEAAKSAAKKNKRAVRGSVKEVNYFASGEPAPKDIDNCLNDVDKIIAGIDVDELAELVSKLDVAGKDGTKVKAVFTIKAAEMAGTGKVKESELKFFK
ncbi:Zuotin [Exophiala xenobiotica]|uniref:Zuotin n=1 Tax=Lithohypha guttulata TaxID=1690604 RepID=A0ABR0JXA8_9EURO|nr:Zuotin [Lithohypha guttulata]KAK5326960.1 Zuotin [Exophiala xenobiotica]